ncbi:MAG: sulfotransferase [Rhodobacteraceae bacterium]|nr:sulfotransferase [Paracoccaceae bacterium]
MQMLRHPAGDRFADQIAARIAGGDHAGALALLLPRVQGGAAEPRMVDQAATCYWALGDGGTALALMRALVEIDPRNAAAWGKIGAMALSLGDTGTAQAAFARTVKLNPRSANALAALNRIAPFARGGRHWRSLRNLSVARDLPAAERRIAFNALGRIEQAAGNRRAAFHAFARCKALTPGRYDPDAVTRRVDEQIARFHTGAKVRGEADGGPRMVFVVGMPRSGTTLVESILSRHPDVRSIGESKALTAAVQTARGLCPGGPWDWFGALDPDGLRQCRAKFRARIPPAPPDAADASVILGKMPLDCLEMGAAWRLFPDARFVFMQRHPLDVGLSCFTTNFHEGNAFSRSLEHIGHLTAAVHRSLDDYAGKLGGVLRQQSYRALVQAPGDQIAALLDHVGLPFDAACLSPEAGSDAVRTASVLQVRAGINTSGLDKWRDYATELQPLLDALGGPEWIAGWEERDSARVAGNG